MSGLVQPRLCTSHAPASPSTSATAWISLPRLLMRSPQDHFANMNRCLQEMLIQSGDDGFSNTTVVLFPSVPSAAFDTRLHHNITLPPARIHFHSAFSAFVSRAVHGRASGMCPLNCGPRLTQLLRSTMPAESSSHSMCNPQSAPQRFAGRIASSRNSPRMKKLTKCRV